MKLFLDSADVAAISMINKDFKIDGVTTNPTIITKSKREPLTVLKELVKILSDEQFLFVQAVAEDLTGILKEAEFINSLKKNAYVKIPATAVGYRAIKEAKARGYNVLATAIYTAEQGFLAAKNGADCLAPYVNRMSNHCDGVQETIELQAILKAYNLPTFIVAASFKNTHQVHELMKAGIEALTLPVDVFKNMAFPLDAAAAVKDFSADWERTYNRKTLL